MKIEMIFNGDSDSYTFFLFKLKSPKVSDIK